MGFRPVKGGKCEVLALHGPPARPRAACDMKVETPRLALYQGTGFSVCAVARLARAPSGAVKPAEPRVVSAFLAAWNDRASSAPATK